MENYFVFPNFDPVAFSLGPIDIRWYALAYLTGFLVGWQYCVWLVKNYFPSENLKPEHFDDLLIYIMVGVILGGRIGYVLFYQFEFYLDHPENILKIWHGGMSFHGGFIGVLIASAIFGKRHGIKFFQITDILACATPIGLFFGRIANFINGELVGRETDVPWAVIFPDGTGLPRHPSQLYEAALEGLVLFIVLYIFARNKKFASATGLISGVFLMEYGLFRFVIEYVRKPDEQLGLYFDMLTMGQILCIPMIIAGNIIFALALKNAKQANQNNNENSVKP